MRPFFRNLKFHAYAIIRRPSGQGRFNAFAKAIKSSTVSHDAGSGALERWRKRSAVKVSGSNGVFPILYVDVYTEADRNAALDS